MLVYITIKVIPMVIQLVITLVILLLIPNNSVLTPLICECCIGDVLKMC